MPLGRGGVRVLPDGSLAGSPVLLFDHALIVEEAVAALRDRYAVLGRFVGVEADPDGFLGEERFTLHQLRLVHEAVLGERMHKDKLQPARQGLGRASAAQGQAGPVRWSPRPARRAIHTLPTSRRRCASVVFRTVRGSTRASEEAERLFDGEHLAAITPDVEVTRGPALSTAPCAMKTRSTDKVLRMVADSRVLTTTVAALVQ